MTDMVKMVAVMHEAMNPKIYFSNCNQHNLQRFEDIDAVRQNLVSDFFNGRYHLGLMSSDKSLYVV